MTREELALRLRLKELLEIYTTDELLELMDMDPIDILVELTNYGILNEKDLPPTCS